MNKIIGCDIDGVIADIEPELHKRIAAEFLVDIVEVSKDKFWMHERFGIDPTTMQDFLNSELCFGDPSFWHLAEPIQHNLDALGEAWMMGCTIHFVTGRHGTQRYASKQWLDKYIGYIYKSLLMDTLQVKHRALKFLGADLMFEDRFQEAETIARKGTTCYLINTPYNQQEIIVPNMHRVPDIKTGLELEGIIQ